MNEKAIVHIVDDDQSLLGALSELLASVGIKAQTYGTVRAFVDARPHNAPGCIILDVRLPEVSGLDFQAQLAGLGILLPAILMTGYGDIPMSVRAMKAGAVDFLQKPFRDQEMIDAVSIAIQRDLSMRAAHGEAERVRDKFATLTQRQKQVMLLVATGKMNKQVAGELSLSEITVKIHRGAAMRKMGARTLADLVRMVGTLPPSTVASNGVMPASGGATDSRRSA